MPRRSTTIGRTSTPSCGPTSSRPRRRARPSGAFLTDSAAALTGYVADIPCGCMVTLSAVGSEGHPELGDLVRTARASTLDRVRARLDRAVAEGEIPASTNVYALARYVQTVQNGMSILARDGADMPGVALGGRGRHAELGPLYGRRRRKRLTPISLFKRHFGRRAAIRLACFYIDHYKIT